MWNLLTLAVFGNMMVGLMALSKKLSAKAPRRILNCPAAFMVFSSLFSAFNGFFLRTERPGQTSFVYGEILSLFFSFLRVFFALWYRNRRRIPYLIGIVLSFSLAFLVRKRSLILIIASFLTAPTVVV